MIQLISFLSRRQQRNIYILLLISLCFGALSFFISLFFVFFIIFLFRSRNYEWVDDLSQMILAPGSGVFKNKYDEDRKKSCLEVHIRFFSGYGIAVPSKGEIISIKSNNKTTNIIMNSRFGEVCLVVSSKFGIRPKLWIKPGDIAEAGSFIGYLPFGGKVAIEISDLAEVFFKENENVIIGKSIIGSLKKE